MIYLKRASAGSGKTYELAKTYIRLLISYKDGSGRHLRREGSMYGILPSIMAVTFTNKATDEMKQRIVDKLSALSKAGFLTDPKKLKKIDYMVDFMKEFHATPGEVAEAAGNALKVLLLNFSDFKVSTIDAFFQTVLHTFAFEVNLDSAFNLEIDSEYIARVGLDAALDLIAAGRYGDGDAIKWIRELISNKKDTNAWNLYQRNDHGSNIYSSIIKKAQELGKESFKENREKLENYFYHSGINFWDAVKNFEEANSDPWKKVHERRREAAERVVRAFEAVGMTVENDIMGRKSTPILSSQAEFDINNPYIYTTETEIGENSGWSVKGTSKKPATKTKPGYLKGNDSKLGTIYLDDPRVKEMDSALEEWVLANSAFNELTGDITLYKLFRKEFAELAVIMEINRRKKEYLESTNTFELADTNSMLRSIINKDDAPFIYERMGSVLRHFLIDEFQDTSRMQWDNFLPLLKNSESEKNDNLIIGDPKQSIYRFRNADYKLISEDVEKEFGGSITLHASDEEKTHEQENTNFRSALRIVQFNNTLFKTLAEAGHPWSKYFDSIRKIYGDCVQSVPVDVMKANLGYVMVDYYPSPGKDETDGVEDDDKLLLEPGFVELPERIWELHERGYKFSEIGILVRAKKHGKAAVKRIMQYSEENPKRAIRVISEESLLVSSCPSVHLIIHALELAAKGKSGREEPSILEDPVKEEDLFGMLHSLTAMALPSVVEAIIQRFITDEDVRKKDAAYLAAFQDAVLDYSASHPSDIGTFLKWWERKSDSLTINSPEESDGVRILTVHKSKGLQYRCVIMPLLDYNFRPHNKMDEWRWVALDSRFKQRDFLPEILPLTMKKELEGTPYEDLYKQFLDEVALDSLNALYVAFTRAENELYVYAKMGSMESYASGHIVDILTDEEIAGDDKLLITEKPKVEVVDEKTGREVITYGTPLTPGEVEETRKKNSRQDVREESIGAYHVSDKLSEMLYKEGDTGNGVQAEIDGVADDEDADPRSDGNRKHQIMEMVTVEDDLPKALRNMYVRGRISLKEMEVWGEILRDALGNVRDYGWFEPANRVLNERSVLYRMEKGVKRPDRIVVKPDGSAVVVDYKFGAEHRSEHRKQVKEYVDLLARTCQFTHVKGYLWYVGDKVEEVF